MKQPQRTYDVDCGAVLVLLSGTTNTVNYITSHIKSLEHMTPPKQEPWTWLEVLMLAAIIGMMSFVLYGDLTGRMRDDLPRAGDTTYPAF